MRRTARKKLEPKNTRLWGVVIVGIFLFIAGLKVYTWKKTSVFFSRDWRTNLIFQTSPLTLVSFPKTPDESTLIITLPESVSVPVPYGYGEYRLGSVWKLGTIEKKATLSAETVSDILGVKIAESLTKPEVVTIDPQVFIPEELRRAFFPWGYTGDGVRTGLQILDQLLLGLKLLQLRADTVRVYRVNENSALIENRFLPDGSPVATINEKLLTNFLEQKFEDAKIRQEGLTVEVFNETDIENVGQKFSRYITNMGGKVIGVGNAGGEITNCEVHADKVNESKTLIRFLKFEFSCSFQNKVDNQKADVVVDIGKSWGERWKIAL